MYSKCNECKKYNILSDDILNTCDNGQGDCSSNADCILPEENFDCNGNCLEEYDCAGVCGGDLILDCNDECGGFGILDECGVCNGENVDMDCAGTCFGDALLDNCGVCDNDSLNDCTEDCNGEFGGDALEDVVIVFMHVHLVLHNFLNLEILGQEVKWINVHFVQVVQKTTCQIMNSKNMEEIV